MAASGRSLDLALTRMNWELTLLAIEDAKDEEEKEKEDEEKSDKEDASEDKDISSK